MEYVVHAVNSNSINAIGQVHCCKLTNEWISRIGNSMDERQKEAQLFIDRAMLATGKSLTELAKMAGLTPSTLTRFYNKPVKHTLSYRTLSAVSECSGVPIPGNLERGALDEERLFLCLKYTEDVAAEEGISLSLDEKSRVAARLYARTADRNAGDFEKEAMKAIIGYLANSRTPS